MKKMLSLFLSVMMAMVLFSGCGAEASSSQSQNSPVKSGDNAPKKNVTITFGIHQSAMPSSGIVQEIAKDFEKKTGIKVDFQISPDAQWRDLLKVKLDSNEAPDMFAADVTALTLYQAVRPDVNCVDLSGEEFIKRMADSVKPAVTYKDKVYGVVYPDEVTYFYSYNKKIFKDLGLSIPKSFAEFKNVCQKIKDSGVIPIYEATQNGWHQVLPLFETGPMYEKKHPGLYEKLNKNEMKVTDIPELLTIVKELKECADLGFYGDDYLNNMVEGADEAFANGKVAMVLIDPGWGPSMEKKYPQTKGNIGMFVMPWGDNQILGVNPASYAYFVNSRGKHIEECLEFLRFQSQHDNLQKRLDGDPYSMGLCWPEIKSKYPEDIRNYMGSLERGTVMQAGVTYIDPQWMDVGKDIDAMYSGAMTPEDVVKSIAERRDEQAKLQKDPAWK